MGDSKYIFKKIILKDIFGAPYHIIAEVIREYEHGYHSSGECASWGLYKLYDDWTPAVFLEVRKKGKRKHSIIDKTNIISIEEKIDEERDKL